MNYPGGNNPSGGKTWSDEKIAQLKRLWDKGHSGSKIAGIMGGGLTRNSVIGAAHRLGLVSRPSPIKRMDGEPHRPRSRTARVANATTCAEKRARKERPARAPEPDLPLAVIPRRRKAPEPAWTGTPVTLAEIGQGQCRYIVGETNGGNTPMCGAPSGHGVWCAEHLVRVSDRRKTEESRASS